MAESPSEGQEKAILALFLVRDFSRNTVLKLITFNKFRFSLFSSQNLPH